MSDLSGFKDFNTDDGEDFWFVTFAHTIAALHGEMESWPEARMLNPTTGEIFQARLQHLLPSIVRSLREGHDLRLEVLTPRGDTNE